MAGFQPSKLEQLVRAIEELPDEQVRLTVSEIMMRYLSWTAPSGEPMIFNGASVGVTHRLRAVQLADILTTLERQGFLTVELTELDAKQGG